MYSSSMSATLRQIVAQSGKLNSWVAAWIGSYSTAARIEKPACSNPSERPPAPAKRSTPMGFCRINCPSCAPSHSIYAFVTALVRGSRQRHSSAHSSNGKNGAVHHKLPLLSSDLRTSLAFGVEAKKRHHS